MPTTEQGAKEKIEKVSYIMNHYNSVHPDKSETFLGEKFNELLDADEKYLDELIKIIKNG